ncbi:hypothetical protein MLD38_040118 [Melastoma candidum]|uniref:Uncharacterized protein n=1 Tax=Melastoma candidum TaxID=119954 RepID=A0ACB9L505_9MYRT|nr:hypothetical protein MLD38_040118 [Melastoma candidum]
MGMNSVVAAPQELPRGPAPREEKIVEAPKDRTPLPQARPRQLGQMIGSGDEDEESGFKTPTSPERKIPVILECPPAPRKPKTKKRTRVPTILVDMSWEIEAMFPINGNVTKRVKVEDRAVTG